METKEVRGKMLERRMIALMSSIDMAEGGRIRNEILALNLESDQAIKLLVDSGGGKVKPALFLCDTIKISKAPVVGVVVGMCGSSAITVLQSCHSRLAAPHAKFFLHFVSTDFSFKANQSEKEIVRVLRVRIEDSKESQRIGENIILSRAKLSRSELRRLMRDGEKDGSELTSREALRLGLIDEIVEHYDLF